MLIGIEVRPRRALEAFWRWEQTWARFTRDILVVGGQFWRGFVFGSAEARRSIECRLEWAVGRVY